MGPYSNEDIVKGIRERKSHMLKFLYDDYYPMIRALIMDNHGTEAEAQDLFQDTVIIIFEKTKSNKFKVTSSFKTYFYAICKKLWLQRLPNLRRSKLLENSDEKWQDLLGWEEFLDSEEEKLFYHHFSELDKDCKKILLNYFNKKRYKELAKILNYKTGYVKKLKFNCKEKLYRKIINDPIYKELMQFKGKGKEGNNNNKGNGKSKSDSADNKNE